MEMKEFIANFISLCYIAECMIERVQKMEQAHNLKLWTVTSDLPWTPSSVRLSVKPALFAFSKTAQEKAWGGGGVIIKMLVSVSRRLANDDCKSLKSTGWDRSRMGDYAACGRLPSCARRMIHARSLLAPESWREYPARTSLVSPLHMGIVSHHACATLTINIHATWKQ